MKTRLPFPILWLPLLVLLNLVLSCSHKYTSGQMDLSFYQWNQWPDEEATWSGDSLRTTSGDLSPASAHPPSCGWEVLHRGNGRLVRIPASIEDYTGVSWYHCRFTLPDLWDGKKIGLRFEAAGPQVEVYLNEQLVGTQTGHQATFDLDVTGIIYYTRDNHLSIRITDPTGGGGIDGNIWAHTVEEPLGEADQSL